MSNLMTNTNTYIKTDPLIIPMSYTTTDHMTDTIIDPIAKPKTDPMMMIFPMTEQKTVMPRQFCTLAMSCPIPFPCLCIDFLRHQCTDRPLILLLISAKAPPSSV